MNACTPPLPPPPTHTQRHTDYYYDYEGPLKGKVGQQPYGGSGGMHKEDSMVRAYVRHANITRTYVHA
jgi:hypothetical protein